MFIHLYMNWSYLDLWVYCSSYCCPWSHFWHKIKFWCAHIFNFNDKERSHPSTCVGLTVNISGLLYLGNVDHFEQKEVRSDCYILKQWRVEGSELEAWTNILPLTLYSCLWLVSTPLNMILVCWYGYDFQKWCSCRWRFSSGIWILQCILLVCWELPSFKLITSRTVGLIWWFLLITFNIWQFVSYLLILDLDRKYSHILRSSNG